MNNQSLLERLATALQDISNMFGPEHTGANLLVLFLAAATVVIGIGLAGFYLSSRRTGDDGLVSRLEGVLQKFERTERNLSEFRAEALRHLEVSRTELEYIRADFESIREILAEQLERGVHQPAIDTSLIERKIKEPRPSTEQTTEAVQGYSGWDSDRPIRVKTEPPASSTQAMTEPVASSVSAEAHSSPEISATNSLTAGEQEGAPLVQRLKKSRLGFFEKIRSVFAGKPKLDEESVADLEAILVGSDLGIKTATSLLTELKEDVKSGADINEGGLAGILKQKILSTLERGSPRAPIMAPRRREDGPVVVLVVGVNGAGKTTSVAKLAHQWKREGSSVLIVAADTFRAAAVEQLHEWGRRLGVPVVSGAPNAKPQTVVYDAMVRAAQEPVDVVIIDTAGRLHTKQNLMDELEGVRNAIQRHLPSAPDEVLLVIDGSTGQNAIIQAREFNAATNLTGLVVTKLDGTSKGGVVVAIKEELGIPIRYIGVGEGAEDLRPFVPRDFVEALLGTQPGDTDVAASVNAATRRQRRASNQ